MGRFFNPDTPVMQWLQKISTVIFCGFFWLLLCIPVITAGASTTAMYREMFNLREDKNAGISDFFRTFGREFGKSTVLWLIEILLAAVLVALFFLLPETEAESLVTFLLATFFVGLIFLWLLTLLFVFPLTAYFENSIGNTLLNAILMPLRHLRETLVIVVLAVFPVSYCAITAELSWTLFFYSVLYILPIWVLLILPLIFYWQSSHFLTVFSSYIPENKQEEADGGESV